jgi:DNA-binding NarL/FixJ family response regulator
MIHPKAGAIRILLIDDHALFREGLVRLLESESDFEVVGCCETIEDGLGIIAGKPVDIVLLDYDLGNEKGSEFLTEVAKCGFKGRTLILTAGVSNLEAKRLVGLGGSGIFLKHDPPNLLAKSIRDVVEGRGWLNQELFRDLIHGDPSGNEKNFTEREREVLRRVVEGLSNKEIGARVSISESAAKAVLQQLFNKTGVRTRSQLVRVALERYRGEF